MKTHTSSRRSAALLSVGALTLAGLALSSSVALAVGTPSYDSRITAESSDSLSFFEANTSEFGDYIRLAGTDRTLKNITVGMNGWACQTGTYYQGTCSTITPGAGFDHPITVTVYAKSGDDPENNTSRPGAVLATVTQTIFVPYRPSADPVRCRAEPSKWYSFADGKCHNGHAFLATFDFSALGVVLPTDVIVSIAYKTTPTTTSASPVTDADLLNVGVAMALPTVGTDVVPANMYLNSTEASTYGDGGAAGMGVFRADLGAWARNPGLILLINTSTPKPELVATGLDSASSAVGLIALGGLALGSAVVAASAVRRRSRA